MRWALALLGACACGGQVEGSDASIPDGGGDGDAIVRDVELPDGFDAASCYGDSVGFNQGCTPDVEAFCQTWTRDRAYGAYGHTICYGGTCTLGDYCPDGGATCRCSPILICAPGQVCYSDTPDGATHCKTACTPSP